MKKNLLTSILLLFFSIIYSQSLLTETYYFVNETEIFAIKKSNDSLYEFKCLPDFQCSENYRSKFKIIRSKRDGNKEILAIERVDSIPLSSNPIPEDRYYIMGLEKLANGKMKIVSETKSYTIDSISKIPLQAELLNNKFGFTYYTKSFLTNLETDYTITKKQAENIFDNIKLNVQKKVDLYKKTITTDLYGSGITAELIAEEMIKLNLSPIQARTRIEKALKK